MKKKYPLIIISLLFSLFIYLFYRTEQTLVTKLLISVISFENFTALKSAIVDVFSLQEFIIYSLPEGLWVFCITLTSKKFFLKVYKLKISLLFVPLLFSIGLEIFQLLRITNGTFDFWDIGISILFWTLAYFISTEKKNAQNVTQPITFDSLFCSFTYLIVYLAHVWK